MLSNRLLDRGDSSPNLLWRSSCIVAEESGVFTTFSRNLERSPLDDFPAFLSKLFDRLSLDEFFDSLFLTTKTTEAEPVATS